MSFPGTRTHTKPTCKAKWQIPQRKGKNGSTEYYLEGELRDRFCKLFPIHSNIRLMQWFGVSFSTLQRFKRELGLKKNMTKIRKEQAKDVKKLLENNGYYDSMRGKQPSPQCIEASRQRLREGFHPMKTIKANDPKRYKRILKEKSERRVSLIRSERRRVELGLTPRTKLTPWLIHAVRPYSKAEVSKRYQALKKGYILGDRVQERYCIFYDADTERTERFENNCIACGFTIAPLPND